MTLILSILLLFAILLWLHWFKKAEEYRQMAVDWSCKYTTLEYEVKYLRRKYEESK